MSIEYNKYNLKSKFIRKLYFLIPLIFSFFFLILSPEPAYTQAPYWLWAKVPVGPNLFAAGVSVVTDASGNVYVSGFFDGPSITFGSCTLTAPSNGNEHLFLVKYDRNGNALWVKGASCTYGNSGISLALDATGHLYMAGSFSYSDITFGTTTLINAGSSDLFLVKYDLNGNVIWAKSYGGNSSDGAMAVKTDPNGNVYLAGSFSSSSISFGSISLANTNNNGMYSYDFYIVKFDANGNILWAKSGGGSYSDAAYSMAVDDLGNAFIAGEFGSLFVTIGPFTLLQQNNTPGWATTDVFLAKYNSNGDVLWARRAGGYLSETEITVSAGNSGSVFLAGNFLGPEITFGTTTFTNNNPENNNLFLAKYAAGGDIQWALSFGGAGDELVRSVASDKYGNAYITGYSNSTSIAFGSISLNNPSGGGNLFVVKLNTDGNPLWTKSTNEPGAYGKAIAVSDSNYVFITGTTGSPMLNFDSIKLTFPTGEFGSYTAKLSNYTVNILHSDVSCNGGNNGTATAFVIGGTAPYTFSWNTSPPQLMQTATNLGAGVYKVTVTDSKGISTVNYVTISQPSIVEHTFQQVICKGDSYFFNGNYFTTSGMYYDTLSTVNGCDSLLKLDLFVDPLDTLPQFQSVCPGGNYNFFGTILSSAGTYYHKLISSHGCDSTISVSISINPDFQTNNPATICSGDYYSINGHQYTSPGIYFDTLVSAPGCDSIIKTDLIVNPSFFSKDIQTICSGNAFIFRGKSYTASGIYDDGYTGIMGCDSIYELVLTVNQVDTTQQPLSICQGNYYNFQGTVLTTTGIYYHTLTAQSSCDSVLRLSLVVNPLPESGFTNDTLYFDKQTELFARPGYAEYTWNTGENSPSIIIKAEGWYSVRILNAEGCTATDSVHALYSTVFLSVPNAFTPDGDGFNDIFRPVTFPEKINSYSMYIFDRWGKQLFYTHDVSQVWDAKTNGTPVPDGIYSYYLRFIATSGDAGEKRGVVTVVK
jgi:gliding motility-associated-like protein